MDQPIYTHDPMEWVETCLHCDLDPQKCKGNCPDKKTEQYRSRVKSAARAICSGLNVKQAAKETGLSEGQIYRYMKTDLYNDEMRRMRNGQVENPL